MVAPVVLGDFRAEARVFGARGFERELFGRRRLRAAWQEIYRSGAPQRKAIASAPAASAASGATQANSGIWWRAQVNWRLA